jgi:mannose-6-phosphate isomerase-like protein (cupin superfamily)
MQDSSSKRMAGAAAAPAWAAFEMPELLERQLGSGQAFVEFLRVPSMSAEIYALPAGGVDLQMPHAEDEIYVVVRGRAMFRAAGEERPVQPGTVLYVQAGVEHRFHSIKEDLALLVLFAPAHAPTQSPPRSPRSPS